MPSDKDRCFYDFHAAPCNRRRDDHHSIEGVHPFTGPASASDAALRALAGLQDDVLKIGKELLLSGNSAITFRLEQAVMQSRQAALNAPAAAVCDVAQETCDRQPSDECFTHVDKAWERYGKFEAAGGNDETTR